MLVKCEGDCLGGWPCDSPITFTQHLRLASYQLVSSLQEGIQQLWPKHRQLVPVLLLDHVESVRGEEAEQIQSVVAAIRSDDPLHGSKSRLLKGDSGEHVMPIVMANM